jgi:hypothetical protein
MRNSLVFAVALLLAACAANPPYLEGEALAQGLRSLPGAHGAYETFGRADWFPFAAGIDEAFPPGRVRIPYRGALALADDALLFAIWDADLGRVDVVKRIAYAEISSVDLQRRYTLRVVIVRTAEGAPHAFHIAGDPEATERLAATLRSRLAPGRGAT